MSKGISPISSRNKRSLVGLFEQPLFVLRRTRETAGAVAEERSLSSSSLEKAEQVLPPRMPSGARPGLVDGLREDLLAGSRLAGEQHRRVRRSDDLRARFTACRSASDEPMMRSNECSSESFVLETRQSPRHPCLFRRTAQQGQDLVVVVAFGDVVEGAVLDGLHAVGDIAVGRQQDHFGGGCDLLSLILPTSSTPLLPSEASTSHSTTSVRIG